jgi:hypothetical protein
VTVKGFEKCCVSNAVNGDDMLSDSEEDENVSDECEKDDGTDCHGE